MTGISPLGAALNAANPGFPPNLPVGGGGSGYGPRPPRKPMGRVRRFFHWVHDFEVTKGPCEVPDGPCDLEALKPVQNTGPCLTVETCQKCGLVRSFRSWVTVA